MDVIESPGMSVDDSEIAACKYQSPSGLAVRRFKFVFATMCLVGFGLAAVVQFISWIVDTWTAGAGGANLP